MKAIFAAEVSTYEMHARWYLEFKTLLATIPLKSSNNQIPGPDFPLFVLIRPFERICAIDCASEGFSATINTVTIFFNIQLLNFYGFY